MKIKIEINERAYILVSDDNGFYSGDVYLNGCSRNQLSKSYMTAEELEVWVEKVKEVYNGNFNS